MNLLIYKKITLESKLSGEKIIKKISENTETANFIRPGQAHKYFHGIIDKESFVISRIIKRKNVFIPLIRGKLTEKNKMTELDLTVSPNLYIIGFITLLFLIMAGVFVYAIMQYKFNPDIAGNLTPPYKTLSLIIAFYIFFITAGTVIFNIELKNALKFLNKILN